MLRRNLHKKDILPRKEGQRMAPLLESKQPNKVYKPASFYEMILDPQKRRETFNYFDNIYEETKDEKEIFDKMTRRRKR